MLEHIENMKTKPEHIRKRYAFVVSSSVSILIFAGWMLSYSFNSNPVVADKKSDVKIESPATSLTASVVGAWEDIKNIFKNGNKVEYSSQLEVSAGKR
jgi:hypothetical protein